MSKRRPAAVTLAMTGKLKSVLSQNPVPNLSAGACAGLDTEMFFSDSTSTTARAKAICSQCPVRDLCLDWAIQNAEFGVFGGLTAKERSAAYGAVVRQDPVEVEKQLRFILNDSLNSIAATFGVDQRTAIRWRKILKDYQFAA
jgi:WhiB family redox-sensing transcriptional regulator